jgi:magnesium chelatase family protein
VNEKSEEILSRVEKAREIQSIRFGPKNHPTNALMDSLNTKRFCHLELEAEQQLKRAMHKLSLSARAYDRIRKVARTIADLAQSETIKIEHITEAIAYRSLDRENWGG